MPRKLPRACMQPGCGILGPATYCPRHEQEREDRKAKDFEERTRTDPRLREARAFYRSPQWIEFRAKVLADLRNCRACGQPSTMLDHVVPISEGGAKLDSRNTQALCDHCHNRKRQVESQRAKGYRTEYPEELLPRHFRKQSSRR